MHNIRMQEKLQSGEAISIHNCEMEGDFYILEKFTPNVDYCNRVTEQWIWSIGRRLSDNKILASHSNELYQNPQFECLFLR